MARAYAAVIMNRKERRAQRASENLGDEERYGRDARLVFRFVATFAEAGLRPKFRFPPRNVGLIADLETIGSRIALDMAAEVVVEVLVEKVTSGCTAMMLRCALDEAKVPWEECTLQDLGLELAGMPTNGGEA